jgi:hypothetical protein
VIENAQQLRELLTVYLPGLDESESALDAGDRMHSLRDEVEQIVDSVAQFVGRCAMEGWHGTLPIPVSESPHL